MWIFCKYLKGSQPRYVSFVIICYIKFESNYKSFEFNRMILCQVSVLYYCKLRRNNIVFVELYELTSTL